MRVLIAATVITSAAFFGTSSTRSAGEERVSTPSNPLTAADLRGAWTAERYYLKTGEEYEVRGQILFTESSWNVIFFVVGEDGELQRGAGEGGTYTIDGNDLVFTHHYIVSPESPAIPGLSAQSRRLIEHPADKRPTEPVTVELESERLVLHFGPSGNRMRFRRPSSHSPQ